MQLILQGFPHLLIKLDLTLHELHLVNLALNGIFHLLCLLGKLLLNLITRVLSRSEIEYFAHVREEIFIFQALHDGCLGFLLLRNLMINNLVLEHPGELKVSPNLLQLSLLLLNLRSQSSALSLSLFENDQRALADLIVEKFGADGCLSHLLLLFLALDAGLADFFSDLSMVLCDSVFLHGCVAWVVLADHWFPLSFRFVLILFLNGGAARIFKCNSQIIDLVMAQFV